jgi:hypothetical protein
MYSPNFFISLPGTPTTVAPSLTFSITTVPAPSVQLLPTFLKLMITLPAPMEVCVPTLTSPHILAPGLTVQNSPI